jgi:hypothetical protein
MLKNFIVVFVCLMSFAVVGSCFQVGSVSFFEKFSMSDVLLYESDNASSLENGLSVDLMKYYSLYVGAGYRPQSTGVFLQGNVNLREWADSTGQVTYIPANWDIRFGANWGFNIPSQTMFYGVNLATITIAF